MADLRRHGSRRYFAIVVFVLILSVGVQGYDAFIPALGPKGPQSGQVELICLYVCLSLFLSVYMSGRPNFFLEIIRAARNFAQRMQLHDMG